MEIIVCIKQVPDTTEIKIDPVTNTLKREGVKSIINPDDKAAIEAALRLQEANGGHVTLLCMGPPQAKAALAEGLAMGADRAILLSDRAFAGSDTLATSTILAAALKKLPYDLIIAGRQAIDGDTAQVGPQIAEQLSLPQVTYAADVLFDAGEFTVTQIADGIKRVFKAKPPLLVTMLSSHVKPRYMHAGRLVALAAKEVDEWSNLELELHLETIGLKGSPTKVRTTFNKQARQNKELVETDAQDAAELILAKIKELGL